jgi:hypothetical protein
MPAIRRLGACAAGLLLALTCGCATIFTGTHEDVAVDSSPANATVSVLDHDGDTVASGHTPHTFDLARNEEKYVVSVKLDGYQEAKVSLHREFNGWVLCNIACGGLLGGLIDFLDGAAWHMRPNELHVTLHAVPAAEPAPSAPPAPGTYVIPGSASQAEPGGDRLQVVFYTRDDDGQLRMLSVPLVRQQAVLAAR